MALDGYLPREGDHAIVHCEVRFDVDPADRLVHVLVGEHKTKIAIALDQIEGIAHRKFSEGERVYSTTPESPAISGTVIAVHGIYVWVDYGSASPVTCSAKDLRLIKKD